MAIKSFAQFQRHISDVMTALPADAIFAPHGNFWADLTYDQVVNGNVPDIGGAPVKILVKGDSAQSAIIQALKGLGIFAAGGRFRRMPAGGPFMSDAQIAEIASWIDDGCPEHEPEAAV